MVFYRVVSGVHASISMHLAHEYPENERLTSWGPNLEVFKERMTPAERCEHVSNLYFAYLFVLQAVVRAAPALSEVHYHTGMAAEDLATQVWLADAACKCADEACAVPASSPRQFRVVTRSCKVCRSRADAAPRRAVQELMSRILADPALREGCAGPFDAGRMWKGDSAPLLQGQLQMHFQNITSVMDCVGCEKCKLWGKLQFLGVATAFKILLSSGTCFEAQLPPRKLLEELRFERNEVIALINLLHKLAQSVTIYRDLSALLEASDHVRPCFLPSDSVR